MLIYAIYIHERDLQSSKNHFLLCFMFAINRAMTTKAVTIVIEVDTPKMTSARESFGLTKLETCPGGGLVSGTFERSSPAGIDMLFDEVLSRYNVKVRTW
jgi:hypothetical protein